MFFGYRYVKSITHAVMKGNNTKGGIDGEESRKYEAKAKKKEKESADALLASLFKGA